MGGGASKAEEPKANDKAAKNQESNQRDAGVAADTANGPKGLQCTVTDAVTNSTLTFTSSVAAGKPATNKKSRKAATAAADKSAANADGEDGDQPNIVRLGDAVIYLAPPSLTSGPSSPAPASPTFSPTTNGSPKFPPSQPAFVERTHAGTLAQLSQQINADRGDWRAIMSVTAPTVPVSGSGTYPGVLVGGAIVNGVQLPTNSIATLAITQTAVCTPHSKPISAQSTPQTDNAATQLLPHGKYTAQQKAAVFTAKTKYAIPQHYKIETCGGQSAAVRAIAASADGTLVASVCAGSKMAQYFDGRTGAVVMEIKGHLDPIVSMAHSRDGKFLLTSSSDGNVCLWDLNNGKKLREIPVTSQANSVAISDDSDTIATSSTEDFVNLWESKNGEALTMFQRHSGAVYCVTFSRRGNLVASGSQNGEIFVWGGQAGDVRLHIETGARTAVMSAAFSHDGSCLLTSDRDVLQLWDLFTGGLIFSRNGAGDVILGDEGKTLHQHAYIGGPKDTPRITCTAFAACNNICCGLTSKHVLILEPNTGTELLSVDVKSLVTCISTSWAGDVIFIGDYIGNHYRLQLRYSHRDAIEFNLNSKPPAKDRGKGEKD